MFVVIATVILGSATMFIGVAFGVAIADHKCKCQNN